MSQIDLAQDLLGAAGRGELVAYFQPQWDVESLELVAVEALCRWRHPSLGMVAPVVFIELAERSGAIHELGDFMIDATCDLIAELQSQGIDLDASLNMSVAQLFTPDACQRLIDRIDDLDLDPSRITVEVTESVEIVDVSTVVGCLDLLRDRGVGVSIDDFGTGHSSREQVLKLPVTEIKIDRSVVQDLPGATLAWDAVELAEERGLRMVAEGVETLDQLEHVRELGCQRAQGYLWGRPASREVLADIIASRLAS